MELFYFTFDQRTLIHRVALTVGGDPVENPCVRKVQRRAYISQRLAVHHPLDDFLKLSEHELLDHAGTISAEQAKTKAELEYTRYRVLVDAQPRRVDADFENAVKELKKLSKPKKPKPPKKP